MSTLVHFERRGRGKVYRTPKSQTISNPIFLWSVFTILLFIFVLHPQSIHCIIYNIQELIEICLVIVKDGMILRNDVHIDMQT